jgi:RNA polymerase sigma-70 factor (ECF subfamily)
MSITPTEADALDRADMERLASGEGAALNDLMDRHGASVFGFLFRMLGNEDDASDLAQETFVRVYRARDKFRRDERFSTWLFTIAANLGRNHFRWRARHTTISLDAGPESGDDCIGAARLPAPEAIPSDQAQAAERAAAVREAVGGLPPELREAIVLCEWEERSVNEAAAILNATPKAVESRLYRARQALRKQLQQWL